MAHHRTGLIEKVQSQVSDTGVEELIREIGLTFWAAPMADTGEGELAHFGTIDEELIQSMGYTMGGLPISAAGGTHGYCNTVVGDIAHSDGSISFNDMQNKASVYMAGYQAGLRAR